MYKAGYISKGGEYEHGNLDGAAHHLLCQGSTNPMHSLIMALQAHIVVLVFAEIYSRKFFSS